MMNASNYTHEAVDNVNDNEKKSDYHEKSKSFNYFRRISRADIHTPPPVSTESSLKREEKLAQKLKVIYGAVQYTHKSALRYGEHNLGTACGIIASHIEIKPESEKLYEFRLFSRPDASQKIVILDEEPLFSSSGSKKCGFVVPNRSSNFYFAQQAEGLSKTQFAMVAVDGDTIKRWSRQRAWALEVPWRVQIVENDKFRGRPKAQQVQREKEKSYTSSGSLSHRKRSKPGKKVRIRLRQRKRTAQAVEEQNECAKELKLQAEKEKRVRRNREKKIKRKLKKVKTRANIDTN